MRPVVHAAHNEAEDENRNDPGDQARAKILHMRTASFRGHSDQQPNQAEDWSAGSDRRMTAKKSAEQKADNAGGDVKKQKFRRAVNLFDHGANVHKQHHVETDVNKPTMQKHGGDQAKPFMAQENGRRITLTEPV